MTDSTNIIHITKPRNVIIQFELGYGFAIGLEDKIMYYSDLFSLHIADFMFEAIPVNKEEIMESYVQYRINKFLWETKNDN